MVQTASAGGIWKKGHLLLDSGDSNWAVKEVESGWVEGFGEGGGSQGKATKGNQP